MAKSPGTPKAKTAAPAQFDMNSRDRKGGKGGGPGRGRDRDDKRPPSRVVSLPPTVVDRGTGWVIKKIGKIDQASHAPAGAEYHLEFDGHEPLSFNFLGAARERAKEPPPEKAPEPAPVEETVAEASADETHPDEAPAEQASADAVAAEHAETTHDAEKPVQAS